MRFIFLRLLQVSCISIKPAATELFIDCVPPDISQNKPSN